MRKVFWENPYQHTLTTKVASVEGNRVLFEDTIAYSFAGGQESDEAFVNDIRLIDSTREGISSSILSQIIMVFQKVIPSL